MAQEGAPPAKKRAKPSPFPASPSRFLVSNPSPAMAQESAPPARKRGKPSPSAATPSRSLVSHPSPAMAQERTVPATKRANTSPFSASRSRSLDSAPSAATAQGRRTPARKRAKPAPAPRAHSAAAGAVDRLSALDDATLHAIVARLPLRDAAATAALARRWRRVFATLPRLRINRSTFNRRRFPDDGYEDRCEDGARWRTALRRVLAFRTAPVAAFEIEAGFTRPLGEWFRRLFRELCVNGVLQELSIANTNYTESYELPSAVYSCPTLTSLDLYNCRLQIPSKICGLRTVRSLRLRNVVVSDADLRRMISRCLAMERLEIHDVHKARSIFIRGPCLERLEIYSYRPLCITMCKALRLDTVKLGLSYGYPEYSWSINDVTGTDEDQSFSGITKVPDYRKMAEREHEKTDEVKNMTKFLGGLGSVKQLRLYLSTEYSEVLSMDKIQMLKRFPQKSSLPALTTLALTLDHSHEVIAILISCLLNSSPNLKDLTIIELCHSGIPVPLDAAFWAEQIKEDNVLNHLSTATFYTDSLFGGHPYRGLCRFLVMHSRVLKRMRIEYHRALVRPEHVAKLEAIQGDLNLWPRASGNVLLELYPVDRCPCF